MKIKKLAVLVAGSFYGITAFAMTAPQMQQTNTINTEHHHNHHHHHHHHGVENETPVENAPTAESHYAEQPVMIQMSAFSMANVQAAAVCNVNALATTNSTTLINEIKSQGVQCVNELFSASSNIQATAFDSNNMYAVANHVKTLSQNYQGGGDANIEAMFLFLRAGYFAEFYNDQITFAAWVTPAIKGAIDAFVNNSHFYDDNDAHGQTLSEVIITMDSSEQQDVYLPIITQWLNRWNESYATKWNMRNAVNNVFTLLFRGQWNNEFKAKIGTQTDLVAALRKFSTSNYMIDSSAEFMLANAARELGRLKKYSDTAIQSSVDAGLKDIFSRYEMVGFGDVAWLGAADTASYYGNCNDYGICNYGEQLESQVLSQTYICSSTIKIRSQNMTTAQHQAACSKMGYEEGYFHTKLDTNNIPVADDNNAQLQVNIFDSSTDYGKYGGPIFGINTNNGGMYLEGDPSKPGNVPNFIAYEASYANPDHYVWNLEHEYVHYLDGRFDLYGDFNAPTEAIVWWSEGVAEYIANEDNNQAAIDTIKDGSTYTLGTIFNTTYDGFDQDRIYRWGYLAVRFMFERHLDEVKLMLNSTRTGDWAAYKARLNNWAVDYDAEFTQWTQQLANGGGTVNEAPVVAINGPYTANKAELINFSSQGSFDKESSIASYTWNFGDGTSSSEANPAHSYVQAGEYTVTLTATDTEGASRTESTTATILGDTTPTNQLKNGESKAISGAQDSVLKFTFVVPAGASNLNFALNGGTGDADLYVKFGSEPTMSDYDCRPYIGGNNETCEISNIQAGTYHVMVYGYNSFDTSIMASFNAGSGFNVPDACATSGPVTGGRLYDGQVRCLAEQDTIWLSLENVSGQNSIAITTANGTGDLSLEYSNQGWPTSTNVDASSTNSGNGECIYINNQSQYWGYLKVSGNAKGASIVVDYNTPGCR